MITAFIAVNLIAIVSLPFLKVNWKGFLLLATVICNSLITSCLLFSCFEGSSFEILLKGSFVTGSIPLRFDALSAWFIYIINFVFVTGTFYGLFYMKDDAKQFNNISLHGVAFVLLHASLLSLCVIQNSLVFLVTWEIMALSAFICVIFEYSKATTLKAGINFLIQSHIAIVFLMLGFIWVAIKTGSFDFQAISTFSDQQSKSISLALFICFFIGFAIKAGFVPFHTWLPYAHPAAPAHISGIMSGVIIKIGIFGILRMLLLLHLNYTVVGYFILFISIASGVYGVMLAIIQHNLKKLLAYHSIENIGIIGMGIGMGCIGIGKGIGMLAVLGFTGALLHTLNHALFKSLLFYTAGNVYRVFHSLNIEQLGGIAKKMPQTSILFLTAAIAICGIPPFNGFTSEFIIYFGLYSWLQHASLFSLLVILFSILALVFIGGLAILCFTKAYGVSFLGNPRSMQPANTKEVSGFQLLPLYIILALMLAIGLFPQYFLKLLEQPVALFSGKLGNVPVAMPSEMLNMLNSISFAVVIFILLGATVYFIRKWAIRNKSLNIAPTWACSYPVVTPKMQYTASSFVRSYSKLFRFIVLIFRHEKEVEGIFPKKLFYETHPYDKIEHIFIDAPLRAYKLLMSRFLFLQNGKLQVYILYGILFITLTICIPFIYINIHSLFEFFKQL